MSRRIGRHFHRKSKTPGKHLARPVQTADYCTHLYSERVYNQADSKKKERDLNSPSYTAIKMSYHTNHWQDHHRRDPQNGADAFNQPGVNATSAHGLALSKQAIIWVSIVVALVTIGLGIVFWLLCSCCWSGRRKTIARMVGDDRMFFSAWNPRGPKMDKWQAEQMKDEEGPVAIADRAITSESAVELRPLKKAAVRPVGSTLPHERMATPEVSSHGFEDVDVNAAHPVGGLAG